MEHQNTLVVLLMRALLSVLVIFLSLIFLATPALSAKPFPPNAAPRPSSWCALRPTHPQCQSPTPVPTPTVMPTPTPTPTATPTATPTPTPPPGNSVTFGPTVTGSQLGAAIANNSINTIFLTPGTYRVGQMSVSANRTSVVTIRPQSSGVIFDGNNVDGHAFSIQGGARNVTFQDLTFEHYNIGERGLFTVGAATNITMNRITFRNSTGVSCCLSWALYLTSGVPTNITANDWVVTGTNKNFSALQSMHDPNANGGTFTGWQVTSVAFAVYLASDATGLEVSGWTITNSGSSHDGGQYSVVAVAGAHIANMTLVNSAGCYIFPPATGSC